MIDFSFLIYDAPLWFIFWVWTKVFLMLLSDSPGIVEKNSYAYLQSLGYEPNVMHLLLMHFLGYVGLPQNSSSRRGCKKKFQHQNFASWHNMGQIMDISKKYTKLVSTKISTLQKGKMKDTTFLGTFSTIWEFSCFRSEKSIEKINIHNVKIWTFRTSSSWENMTHEHTCNSDSRQKRWSYLLVHLWF